MPATRGADPKSERVLPVEPALVHHVRLPPAHAPKHLGEVDARPAHRRRRRAQEERAIGSCRETETDRQGSCPARSRRRRRRSPKLLVLRADLTRSLPPQNLRWSAPRTKPCLGPPRRALNARWAAALASRRSPTRWTATSRRPTAETSSIPRPLTDEGRGRPITREQFFSASSRSPGSSSPAPWLLSSLAP